jgi:hypothetical protein
MRQIVAIAPCHLSGNRQVLGGGFFNQIVTDLCIGLLGRSLFFKRLRQTAHP